MTRHRPTHAAQAAADSPLTLEEVRNLPAVIDLRTAARAFGLGRTRAYELAARGAFPCRVLRVGGTYRVPTAGLLAALGLPSPPAADDGGSPVDTTTGAARDSRDPRPGPPPGRLPS